MARGLLATAAAVVVVAGLKAAATVVGPILLALVLVVTVSPVTRWLHRRGWPRWLATTLLLVVLYGFVAACAWVLVASVARLTVLLPEYATQAQGALAEVRRGLTALGVTEKQVQSVIQTLEPGQVLTFAGAVVGSLAGVLSNVVFMLALIFFMGIDAATYPRRVALVAGAQPTLARALHDFARGTQRYFVVATLFGLAVAALDGVALWALGIPLPVLWALLAFITNYIPNVGFVIGLAPPAVLALLGGGVGRMVAVIVVYAVVNFVLQSLVQPKIVGETVDLTATVTFLALVFWTWVIGGLGAILAVPLTLLAKALLVDAAPQTRWARHLIGARPTPDATDTQPDTQSPE